MQGIGLIITFALGVFILVGALVVKLVKNSEIIEQLSIAVALGTMVALSCGELIPDVLETFHGKELIPAGIAVALGVGFLILLDHFIPDHEEQKDGTHESTTENMIHIGIISAIAIILHNIVEGMSVYSLAGESILTGILVALGVGLHNIPMGMLIYSTLHGDKRSKQIIVMALTCLSTFAGGLLMVFISPILNEFVTGILICIAIGMLIYIIGFELVPHVIHTKRKWLSAIGAIVGIAIIVISTLLE